MAITVPSGKRRIAPTTYEKHLGTIKWRDINFPYDRLHTDAENQLVIHEYPDKDAAHVESTGRRPIEISCTAIFYNHIDPGPGENWTAGDLFPNLYNKFIAACMDSSPGVLVHPTLGPFTAKCYGPKTTIDASARGGAMVDVRWVETINVDSTNVKTPPSVSSANANSDELGNVIFAMSAKDPRKLGLLGLLDAITGAIQLIQLKVAQTLANIDRALYHVNNLLNAIDSFDDNIMAKIKVSANNLKSTLIRLKKTSDDQVVKLYRPTLPTSIAQLALTLVVPVADLCRLNPALLRHPIVPAGTPIIVPSVPGK